MNPFETFLASQPTVDTLIGFNRRAAIAAGVMPDLARKWSVVHDTYFGTTRFTRQQRTCLDAARKFPLSQLVYMEQRLKDVPSPSKRWRVRRKLLKHCSTHQYLKDQADKLIPKTPKAPPQDTLTITRSNQGKRTLSVTANERDIADIEHYLRQGLDPDTPANPQMLRRYLDLIRGDGTTPGVPHAVPRPIVVATMEQHEQIVSGDGDEVILGLSDGTTMTGAEYLTLEHGGEVALFHPQYGAVNLYRVERFANEKQRDLARVSLTVCAWPGCRIGSDFCEVHHMIAWSEGGETNMVNLVMLCPYHNRVNADNPNHKNTRGVMKRVGGRPTWVSPHGWPKTNDTHPYGALDILYGSKMIPVAGRQR